ncbi:hypothetical protein Taro_034004 [Colocasia esculenta]|uniref:Uncharacterized protein n=1 Tax=Colocasia esculenta TaxID=4460 RepID=A0A843W8P4_COLES|nr:hypothetical protein [Colocasia esculenta]
MGKQEIPTPGRSSSPLTAATCTDSHLEVDQSHFEIDLKGELMEKMGQPIRTRNLKKSGFSLVFARLVRLGGPPGWAQSTHRFFACERDRGVRRVLNATAVGVALLLPSLSVDVCMRAKCCALGGLLTSGVGRRRPPTSCSGRDVLNRCAVFKNPGRIELPQALPTRGRLLWGFSKRFKVLEVFLARSRREDVAWSGRDAVQSVVFAFFVKVGCSYVI